MKTNAEKKWCRLTLIFCMILLSVSSSMALERRRPQFLSQDGYLIIPAPYSLPGIGQGIVIYGSANNIAGTYLDLYGYKISGDADGFGFGLDEFHLISETLIVGIGRENINRASILNYNKRGMATEKADYSLLEVSNVSMNHGSVILSFSQRMVEPYIEVFEQTASLDRVRDPDGNIIAEFQDPELQRFKSLQMGLLLDYTDDRQDPRQGLKLDIKRSNSPRQIASDPNFYRMDYEAAAYLPVGKYSTWVFNVFRSDAVVTDEGETNLAKIANSIGLDCTAIVDPVSKQMCEKSKAELVNNAYNANKYGTSASLGGRSRLRSYPGDRFIGAHTLFGTEFRWNLTNEFTPFNWWIMKDVRTGIQTALFFEVGSVAETAGELGDLTRSSYGIGFRVITGSGLVYRIDLASGDEGQEVTMIASYPW